MNNEYYPKKIKHYIIIPLNTLSINVSYKKLINHILDFYIIKSIKDKGFMDFYDKLNNKFDICYKEFINDKFYEINKNILKVKLNNFKKVMIHYKKIIKHNKIFENSYNGRDAKIKIFINLLNDIILKNALNEKQFRILCAIYSVIGMKPFYRIYNYEINYRANGYRSVEIYNNEMKRTKRQNVFYSNKIIRKIRIELKYRNFFDIFYDKRKYFYSILLRDDKLKNAVLYRKLSYFAKLQNERNRYEEFKNEYNEILSKGLNKNKINKIFEFENQIKNFKYLNKKEFEIKKEKERERGLKMLEKAKSLKYKKN